MLSVVVMIGRSNVGKSTLFNRLTKTKRALVDNFPGVTRDRLYGLVRAEGHLFTLVDTAGFDLAIDQDLGSKVYDQINLALIEATIILFLVDGKTGLNPLDQEIVRFLRCMAKPVIYVVNKVDNLVQVDAAQEFQVLGGGTLNFISAAHGLGIRDMIRNIINVLPPQLEKSDQNDSVDDIQLRIALIGRPNVGKSSLLNALLGQSRAVVSDIPGTTRDTIDTFICRRNRKYLLMDTVGIRRRGRIKYGLEKIGVYRSLKVIENCHVVLLVIDAFNELVEQDLHLVGQVVSAKKALIVILNKWDLLAKNPKHQERVHKQIKNKIKNFASWALILCLSAKTGKGISKILPYIDRVWFDYSKRIATGPLNQVLKAILLRHSPPFLRRRQLKFYYASQISIQPPTIVLFVNNYKAIHYSYQRYLVNELRRVLQLNYSPLVLIFRSREKSL